MFLLVAHFVGPLEPGGVPDAEAQSAAELLGASPDCVRMYLAQATDNSGGRVLVAEFESARDYRRALSPFGIRTVVVPWLSSAIVSSTGVSEVSLFGARGNVRHLDVTVEPPQ